MPQLSLDLLLFLLFLLLQALLLFLGKQLVLSLELFLPIEVSLLLTLRRLDLPLAWLLGHRGLAEGLHSLLFNLLALGTGVSVHTSVNKLAEFLDFLESLLVFLLHLAHNLQRSVLLAEHTVVALSVHTLHLQEVVCATSTLDVERDHTSRVLALNARAISLATDDALQIEALRVNLAHAHRSFGSHCRSRDPHCAAQMDPLVEGVSGNGLIALESLFVALEEERVVFRNLGDGLRFEEMQFNVVLGEVFSILSLLVCHLLLIAALSVQNLRQRMVLVLSLEEMQALAPVRATLLAKYKRSFLSLGLIASC